MLSTSITFDPVREAATGDGWTLQHITHENYDGVTEGTFTYYATLTAAMAANRGFFQADPDINLAFEELAKDTVVTDLGLMVDQKEDDLRRAEGLAPVNTASPGFDVARFDVDKWYTAPPGKALGVLREAPLFLDADEGDAAGLTNLGAAGSALDAVAFGAPIRLAPDADDSYLWMGRTASNFVRTSANFGGMPSGTSYSFIFDTQFDVAPAAVQYIWYHYTSGSTGGFRCYVNTARQIVAFAHDAAGDINSAICSEPLPLGRQRWAITYERATLTFRFWLWNGTTWVQHGDARPTLDIVPNPGTTVAYVGGVTSANSDYRMYSAGGYAEVGAGGAPVETSPFLVVDYRGWGVAEASLTGTFTPTVGPSMTPTRVSPNGLTVVPSRSRGGRSVYLFDGSDDRATVPAHASIDTDDDLTWLVAQRTWNNPSVSGRLVTRYDFGATRGLQWLINTTGSLSASIRDGDTTAAPGVVTVPLRVVASLAQRFNRLANWIDNAVDGAFGASNRALPADFGAVNPTGVPITFGMLTGSVAYLSFDLFAAALVRRSLTDAELTDVSLAMRDGIETYVRGQKIEVTTAGTFKGLTLVPGDLLVATTAGTVDSVVWARVAAADR